jgi:hypothetical protein
MVELLHLDRSIAAGETRPARRRLLSTIAGDEGVLQSADAPIADAVVVRTVVTALVAISAGVAANLPVGRSFRLEGGA